MLDKFPKRVGIFAKDLCGSSFDLRDSIQEAFHHGMALRDYYYLPPGKLLEMVTIDAAKCVGWDDELGSLEAGKKADVITVILQQPHLTPEFHQAVASDVDNVIDDRKIIMEDWKVLTVNEKLVLEKTQEESLRMIDRAGLEKYMQPTKYFCGHARAYVDERRYDPINQ